MPRKLIEVALPLEAINREAAREKSIRHGHPSTLHLWWARRPLAACRAVLFAQLVDDPSAHPDRFPTEEAQDAERQRLFRIIEELVKWENTTNEAVLNAARAEIRACFGPEGPPPVLDPFCGGGSIPLEAQRLGLEAHASDLNPVAVLITKALIEIPPKFAGRPPVHPDAERRTTWIGAQGLAEDVRRYGAWMRDEAERRIGHLYPTATLPDGTKATVIAWLWARTVTCPNPACQAWMPLVRSFWLGKKKGKEAWVNPVVEGKGVRFEIGHGKEGPPVEGTVSRNGATCLVCGEPVPLVYVRSEGRAGRMGAQLMAIVAEGHRARIYVPPNDEHEQAALIERPDDVPDTEIPHNPRYLTAPNYGMTHHADLFTNRQLVAATTITGLVTEARERVLRDSTDSAYADAVATYLAFATDRFIDRSSSICTWDSSPSKETPRNTFARQAIPMTWDFAEGAVFGGASGNIGDSIDWEALTVERLSGGRAGHVEQRDATGTVRSGMVFSTDPPYYDNVGYADLADFFYIWLRRSLRVAYPDLFGTLLTPKQAELVADPFRAGGDSAEAESNFRVGFERAFAAFRQSCASDVPLTVFYAFRQAETDVTGGTASTGWETMLGGLLRAGWAITGTWPMRTELGNRMRNQASNALASSIVLACRPRLETAGVTDRQGFLRELRAKLPGDLRTLQQGYVAPVDLAQAAIGPGMSVFSAFARVVEPTGEAMSVRTALGLINQVLGEVLSEQEDEFDADTRWAIRWFEQFGMDHGEYGTAEVLATAMNTSIRGLEQAGLLSARAGKVGLLGRDELPSGWDPAADRRTPVWEVCQHLMKRLSEGGDVAAADLLRQVGGLGDAARDLAYRLYAVCERKGWSTEGQAYNALVTAWPELARLAASPAVSSVAQGSLDV